MCAMAGKRRKKIREPEITGLKYLKKLLPLLERVHDAGTPGLQDVQGLLTIVDGTLLAALPQRMEASLLKRKTGSGMVTWRLHTHFEVDRSIPSRIDVTRRAGDRIVIGKMQMQPPDS